MKDEADIDHYSKTFSLRWYFIFDSYLSATSSKGSNQLQLSFNPEIVIKDLRQKVSVQLTCTWLMYPVLRQQRSSYSSASIHFIIKIHIQSIWIFLSSFTKCLKTFFVFFLKKKRGVTYQHHFLTFQQNAAINKFSISQNENENRHYFTYWILYVQLMP